MYRGILMPFSSDGSAIDFIYGVINWKELADDATTNRINEQIDGQTHHALAVESSPVWADGPHALPELADAPLRAENDDILELGTGMIDGDEEAWIPGLALDPNAGLADRLAVARESADAVKSADGRSRAALYRALGEAYDFALAAEADPADYVELLEDAGLKAQDRAPMTPIVKLVFGVDYDKTRLTEFAAALSYARRQDIALGAMQALLEQFEGGLKGLVAAERRERRPQSRPDSGEKARAVLRSAAPVGYAEIDAGEAEFVLLVARRDGEGRVAVVAPVRADQALIDRALRNSV
jgi:hypothetical protein